jgi:prepilin-type N-terminal cleavage/methylation domain
MTTKRFHLEEMKTTGLTLIELVIVCAIIAVLVGIVWVVMAPAREKARQAVCISNLTQIGHAFRMYRDDWDGVEPQKGMQLEYWQLGLPPDKGIPSLDKYLKRPRCLDLPQQRSQAVDER